MTFIERLREDVRERRALYEELREIHGFSEIEARDYVRFCGGFDRVPASDSPIDPRLHA